MLVNSVGNAKSVGSIVQSKKNNTTNIIKHLHVYGVFNFKHWPIPDFRLMFFLVFSKRTLNHCSELGTSFPFLVLDDPSQIYNGDPVFTWSWDDYVKDISQIQDHFRDGIDGMCQTTKKNLVSGFHPVSPSRKIFGWTSELWRFPRSWGSHGGIHQRLGYPHDYGNLNPFGTTSARTLPLAQETGHRAANRRRHWGWPTSRPHGSRGLNTQLPCEWEDRVLNHQILANHVFRHSHVMNHLS